MAGDAVVLCSDILDMATVCDHGYMSPEWKEQREKKARRAGKGGALESVSGISRTSRMAIQPNPVQFMYYFHKSRSCAAVLRGKYEVRFGRILDGGTSLEGRHNPFFFLVYHVVHWMVNYHPTPFLRKSAEAVVSNAIEEKTSQVKTRQREEVLAFVGVGLEQGRGYLGSHFGKVRACVSVFKSVQGVH